MSRYGLIGGVAALVAVIAPAFSSGPAGAAEKGIGFYLLGSSGPMAGFTPPPGLFIQNDAFAYSGEAGADIQLPFGGQVIASVEATTVLELPTAIFTATLPIGYQEVDASIGRFSVTDEVFTVGDPVFSGFMGWHAGNFHWQSGVAVNTPIEDYQEGEIANIAF